MATAYPIVPVVDEPHRGAAVLQTWEDFEREARALSNQGLQGEDFVRALSGGPGVVLRTPEELEAFIKSECDTST
jgi:hypothetical protein